MWKRLNDPETLKACIPGCQSYVETAPDTFDVVVVSAIGPVKATFKGTSRISDRRDDAGYRIEGQGNGGMAGFGKMVADVTLVDGEGGTTLTYVADAQVGGKLAQIGSRLIQSAASKFANDFFKRFNATVSGTPAA